MLTDDLPENLTATEVGDMIWVPYSGKSLDSILTAARRKGWEYRIEPHGLGNLLHCIRSGLGDLIS